MIENIYKSLKDDIWCIIEGEEPEEKEFLTYILSLMINRKKFKMREALDTAQEVKEIYERELQKVTDSIQHNHGEILKVLNELKQDLQSQIEPKLAHVRKEKV